MSNKILIVGALACLSAVAVAQSDQSKEKAPAQDQVAIPRDAASGQASGQRMHKPVTVTAEDSAREAATGKATGKTANDDWQASAAKSSQPKTTQGQSRVAAGDVNGDGKADVAAPKNPGQATSQNTAASSTSSDVKSPRDISTGQASGNASTSRSRLPKKLKPNRSNKNPEWSLNSHRLLGWTFLS
jgi:hypothetical protein